MACDIVIVAPDNDPCAFQTVKVGKQLVGFLIQDMRATPLPTPITLASIQAALTDPDYPMRIIKNLAASTVAEPTDQVLTGNDVPYGTSELTDRTRTLSGRMQYLTPADVEVNNGLNRNQSPKRVYSFDDLNATQGPYDNSSVVVGGYLRPGAGTNQKNSQLITVTHNGLDEPKIGVPIPGIAALVNAA